MAKKVKQVISKEQNPQRTLHIWPGVVIVLVQWLVLLVLPALIPQATPIGVIGGMVGGLAVIVWWSFFSRASRSERWGAVALMIIALAGTSRIVHESIGTGYQGMMFFVYAIPVLSLAFVIWAVASRHQDVGARRVTMVATILLACSVWILFRSEGITGDARADFTWRWSQTHEERLLTQTDDEMMVRSTVPETIGRGVSWPGFRGPGRDAVIHGIRIETDWSVSPPDELWRRPIGPGCSSFAVQDNYLYTQEQRGDDEIVACYNLKTGEPVWRHADATRFWDSHAGAGPRGTPAFYDGHVYTLGATGILNALNAQDGTLIWSRSTASDSEVELPGWGFTSSPLVVDEMVIVAVAGTLLAYDLNSGNLRWTGPDGGGGYSSPHLLTSDGIRQILLMSEVGVTSVSPADGSLIWMHSWQEERIVQPALIRNGDLLISAGGLKGLRRITVKQGSDGWDIQERWTSSQLKPNFNDIVIHNGHVFGFNGPILTCLDIENGKRKWRGGRYGGQLILLTDQDILLVLSEKGELALVNAAPDQFTEIALFPAIQGKTWNHPVLVGNILVVRNSEEMAAFRLSLSGG